MEEGKPVVLVVSAGQFARPELTEILGYCGCEVVWLGPDGQWPGGLRHLKPELVLGDEDARWLSPLMRRTLDVPLLLAVQAGRGKSPVIQPVFRTITKPLRSAEVMLSIERALVYRKIAINPWEDNLSDVFDLLGASDSMHRLYRTVEDIGSRDGHVLIYGERGTGKERLARAIHCRRPGSAGPIHFVDCRTVQNKSYQDQLFAPLLKQQANTAGIRESTLFLGEAGTLSLPVQQRLLTALLWRQVPLGEGARKIELDVRIIAASDQPLEKLAEEGRFLPKLLRLLGRQHITIPPLRERKGDILFLARRVVEQMAGEPVMPELRLPRTAEAVLLTYAWPGNARELRQVVGRAAALSEGYISPERLRLPPPTGDAVRRAMADILADQARAEHRATEVPVSAPTAESAADAAAHRDQ